MKEILIVSGETSGEEHAADLVRALRHRIPEELSFFGSGGKCMAGEGVELFFDVSKLAAIGPAAAVMHLGSYLRLFRRIVSESGNRQPALAILVDFPDFNLPLSARLKAKGIPVCYFISPQIWAWRQSRVKHIHRNIDLMLVILPFEEDFYEARGIEARYIGNPSATRFRQELTLKKPKGLEDGRKMIALLPGSRKKEVEHMLHTQLDSARTVTGQIEMDCVVVKAPAVEYEFLSESIENWKLKNNSEMDVQIRENSRDVFRDATCAVVKSGTSTLEAMLAAVPFAMVYRISSPSYYLLRPFVRTQTYCLANLVAGHRVAPEFVQHDAKGEAVGEYLLGLLNDPEKYRQVQTDLRKSSLKLGDLDAGKEAARLIDEKFFTEVKP